MNGKFGSLRTIRWEGAVATAAIAVVMCVPAISAQAVDGEGASPRSDAVGGTVGGFSGGKWGDTTVDSVSKDAAGTYQAERDPGSLYTVSKAIGARSLWVNKDESGRALTGQGVSVAVLD